MPKSGVVLTSVTRISAAYRENKRPETEREILKKDDNLLCQRVGIIYGFIRQQMKAWPVTLLSRVMRGSRSGFCQYLKRVDRSPISDPAETAVKARISAVFKEHRRKYGARRIMKQLHEEGLRIGICKVRRMMRDLGIGARPAKRFKGTADSRHSFPVAPNVLSRESDAGLPDRVRPADITYGQPHEGRMCLVIVTDLFSRRIVGRAMDKHMKAQLTIDALASRMRKPGKGLVHHSDRGSRYACYQYKNCLTACGMIPGMSRKSDCRDNAPTERFFRSPKSERLSDYSLPYDVFRAV